MIIKQVRVSQQAKDQLSRLKGKTGIKNWNVLCRWALCYLEMSWLTFGGDYYELYEALVKAWCQQMKLPTDNETVIKYFRLNLERGIAHLCGTGFIKEFDDLIKLAVKEKRA